MFSKAKRLLRYCIRDLLWLAVVAAVAASWKADRLRMEEQYEDLKGQAVRSNERARELEEKYKGVIW